jgi:thiol-disulfide isomerase/thioredoxin
MKLFICLLFPLLSWSQQPLSIGDKLPREVLASLTTNLKSITSYEQLSTSNFQLSTSPRLVIFDFFATYCIACIRELPKLDSLQKQFKNQLQIIIITNESKEKLEAFRRKNRVFASCTLPIVTGDTVFKKLFPHKYLPHQVWINAQGIVSAITGSYYLNALNIQTWIAGKQFSLPVKADAMDFDAKKPLLQNGNGGDESLLLFRSMLTHRLKGMGASEGYVKHDSIIRRYHINNTILILYQKTLGFDLNRIILEVADSSRYILPASLSEEWQDANLYSYEITAPLHWPKAELDNIMRQDLNRSLGLHGRIEKRCVECWLLKRNKVNETLLATRSVLPEIKTGRETGNLIFRNQSIAEIVSALNTATSPALGNPIILDETGIGFNIDLEIPQEALNDISLLKTFITRYGLELIPAKREIEMFVLTEPGYSPSH